MIRRNLFDFILEWMMVNRRKLRHFLGKCKQIPHCTLWFSVENKNVTQRFQVNHEDPDSMVTGFKKSEKIK